MRVMRGGSFANSPASLRSANRSQFDPTVADPRIGFRIVLFAPETTVRSAPSVPFLADTREPWQFRVLTPEGSGATDPSTGEHEYGLDEGVTASASAAPGWEFSHWLLDSAARYSNPLAISPGGEGEVKELKAVFVEDFVPAPPAIGVEDSIPPAKDRFMPFGRWAVGQSRTEQITVHNLSDDQNLVVEGLDLPGAGDSGYIENFQDGQAQGWAPSDPSLWEVVDGEYRTKVPPVAQWIYSTYTDQIWADSVLEVTHRRTGHSGWTARVYVRVSEDFVPFQSGSAYSVFISGGSFWVSRYVGGQRSSLTSGWTWSPLLNSGETTNVIRIEVEGDELRVYFTADSPGAAQTATYPARAA